MADVFISYARDDRVWVEPLAAALAHAGFSVWWDVRTRPGQSFDAQIEQALAEAKAVVVVWSQAALASHWVKAEAGEALQRGILIPVLKENVVPPLLFRQLHHADLTDWTGASHRSFDDVVAELEALIGAAPAIPAEERTRLTVPPTLQRPPVDEPTTFLPRALQAGEVVGHYRIVAPLGEGGSGAIYEARNIHNEDERVALKIVQPDIADRDQFFGFLRAEANAMQQVKHDAVVQYRTFGRIEGSDEFFLVIEFVEGPTLGAVLREHPLPAADIRRLAVRLAHGLEAAHLRGVIHRDLSPDNIVLPNGDPDRATIIDFGIARNGAFDPLGTSFAGKLSYAAPEQFGGDASRIGPWTDLYSYALVLVAAARGRKLEMGRDIAGAIAARQAVPDLENVPDDLKGPLSALLQPLPELRVRSAAEAAALFAAPQPVSIPADGHAEAPRNRSGHVLPRDPDPEVIRADPASSAPPRRRWPWLVGGLLLLGGAAVAVVFGLPLLTAPREAAPAGQVASVPAPQPSPTPEPAGDPPAAAPTSPPTSPAGTTPAEPAANAPAGDVLDPRLTAIVKLANDAADNAQTAAAKADLAAAKADEAIAAGEAASNEAEDAARQAREAAQTACSSDPPPPGFSCGKDANGTSYAGQEVCSSGACIGDGYNVLTYPDGSRIEGRMKDNEFVVGCHTEPALAVYCGQMNGGVDTGFGVKRFDYKRTLAGAFIDGVVDPRGLWDASQENDTGVDFYRGDAVGGTLEGSGLMRLRDGTTIAGDWAADVAAGFGVVSFADGTAVAAAYGDAPAAIGTVDLGFVSYPSGAAYAGELKSNGSLGDIRRNGLGALYDAEGRIEQQGRWRDDVLVEDFAPSP